MGQWINSLFIVMLVTNVSYITYEVKAGRKEKKRSKMIAADKLAWEAYMDAYKQQQELDELE